jgi:hypothetical protein
MAVNVKKTKFIVFYSKSINVDLEGKSVYFDDKEPDMPFDQNKLSEIGRIMSDHVDSNMRVYKTLGVHFDENLNLNLHIDFLLSKLSKAIYMLNRVKNVLPTSALKSIYYALFQSHLLYCPTIISIMSNNNISKITEMQKKAITIISHAQYNAHATPLFAHHKIMPYSSIIKQSKLQFMHSYHHN